jgi:YD repeat-containing protein
MVFEKLIICVRKTENKEEIMKFSVLLPLVLFALIALPTQAGVNLKNGNFYISYLDIKVPGGGNDLSITRTYNSKSTANGWFGFGWGNEYETYLSVEADGSVVIHENGSGAQTRFVPKKAVDPVAASKRILEAMRKKSKVPAKTAEKLVQKLAKDAELRQIYARRYGVKTKIPKGSILYSNTRGLQEVKKMSKGFVRKYSDGKKDFFNEDGQLSKISHKNGYAVNLNYKKRSLASIKDSAGKQLYFKWYPDGKVKKIWSAGDKAATYTYEGKDLVKSKDVAGNLYIYEYDANHNMTAVKYSNGKSMKMSYEPKTYFVSSITDVDGQTTKYKYESNPKNPYKHYWTTVSKKSPTGKTIDNRYEYEIKNKPDGEQYTYRIMTKINGVKTETIYSECCGLPLKISRGKHVTNFEYNKDGLLTKKYSSKGESVELEYHKKHKKITKVRDNRGWTKFEYSKSGDLVKALNDKGKIVRLDYNLEGRIRKMVDYNKRTKKERQLTFKYNPQGKPIEISMSNVGKIQVQYDNYGEIKNVSSKGGGRKMALQVTQAFQSLLAIVKPAGVNLSL